MGYYDEVEIEDMTFDEAQCLYHFPCPCGDRFEISIDDLQQGIEVAKCPSCSLIIRVIFDPLDFEDAGDAVKQQSVAQSQAIASS